MGKLINFSEGKIKIHNNEPVIAFKFTGKEPFWDFKKQGFSKLEQARKLKKKIQPLAEELEALIKDIKASRESFWSGFRAMFDDDSKIQLGKFDQEIINENEIVCIKPDEDDVKAVGDRINKLFDKEVLEDIENGKFGEPVGGFVLRKNASPAEMRAKVRQELTKALPKELLPKIDMITDKMVEDLQKGKNEGSGGFSINVDTGEVDRVI